MRYVGIIILLVLCLNLLLFTGCGTNTIEAELKSGNLKNQEDINRSSNNSQGSSKGLVEEPVIEEDTEATVTVYPQQWATGDGTAKSPWANNCLNTALTNCPNNGTIYLKSGYYQLAGTLTVAKQINIIGEGMNKTIILTVDDFGITVTADYVTLKGFTVDGDAQTDGYNWQSCIAIDNCDYALLEDIEVINAGVYGICPYQVNYSIFQNLYLHDNYRHGIHPGSDTSGKNKHNTYRNIYAWDNLTGDGFSDRGSTVDPDTSFYNVYDNIVCWDNGRFGIDIDSMSDCTATNLLTSGNTLTGIFLANIKNFSFTNLSANDNGEKGIWLLDGSSNINLTKITINGNGNMGLWLEESEDINITNAVVLNNYSGIALHVDCSNLIFTSCQSYDDRVTPLQQFGLEVGSTNTGISLLNCKLLPNVNGDIYNPAEVVVTVITEKMLAKF